jgi:hypothetical protein
MGLSAVFAASCGIYALTGVMLVVAYRVFMLRDVTRAAAWEVATAQADATERAELKPASV